MSRSQADAREFIVATLQDADWSGSAYGDNEDYEEGLYAYHEASLEYRSREGVRWRFFSNAREDVIYLIIEISPDVEISLIIREANECLARLLPLVVKRQEFVNRINYEAFLRCVVDVCPEVYAADTPQGLVRLANLKEDDSSE